LQIKTDVKSQKAGGAEWEKEDDAFFEYMRFTANYRTKGKNVGKLRHVSV